MLNGLFWVAVVLWSLYALKGVLGLLLNKDGDHNWFIWPPIVLIVFPFLIARKFFDLETGQWTVVVISGVMLCLVVVAWLADKQSAPAASENDDAPH